MNWSPDKIHQEYIKVLMKRSRPQFSDYRKYLNKLVEREYLQQ